MKTELRPFFTYYGGKWRAAKKHYPAPVHDVIIEPFAGSAGYATRYADRKVVLYEKDPIVAGVWSYLIRVKADEIMRIPDVDPEGCVDELRVCEEARWLVGFWLNKGASGPRRRPSSWMRSGIRPGSFWGESVRQRLASQVDSIRHWVLVHGDYRNCQYPGPATWFVDPPYELAGKHYRFGSEQIDYAELASWCQTRNGQVIVCENSGATWLPFKDLANVKTARRTRSNESLWLGGRS